MINILAVIISIAITSLMGAAGVFYLGTAFTTSGPKAIALGIVQGLSQLDASWTLYSSNGLTTTLGAAGSTFPTMTGAATGTDLITTGYLAAVPTAPTNSISWGAGGALPAGFALDLTNPATATGVTNNVAPNNAAQFGGVVIILASSATSACLAVAQAGGQTVFTGGLPTTVATATAFTTAFNGFKFGCVQATASAGLSFNNVVGAGAADNSKYIAYYKY